MKTFASYMDSGLEDELRGLSYVKDGTGIFMAFGQGKMPAKMGPLLLRSLYEVSHKLKMFVVAVMANDIPPGVDSGVHVDPGPRRERWHLPVSTNPGAIFWCEETGEVHMKQGIWHGPVEFWKPHRVFNGGDQRRLHLVVDLVQV